MSQRIAAVTDLVPACCCLADIGCDHGQIGLSAFSTGKASRVISTDISEPSLAKAREAMRGLKSADFRCGDGLHVLAPGEADVICIAGMGGRQIIRMLEECPDVARSAEALVLLPHRNAPELRSFLRGAGYCIEKESVVLERAHYYTPMRVVLGPDPQLDPLWNLIPQGSPKDAVYRGFLQSTLRKMNIRKEHLAQAAPHHPNLPALQLYIGRIEELTANHDGHETACTSH